MPLSTLLARNTAFAATDAPAKAPAVPFIPHQLAFVVTCLDPRTDPANFLGLDLGDAIVLRCLGGRITPAVLEQIAYVSYLLERKTPAGPYFEIAVVHHTDCGTGFLANSAFRREFAATTGYDDLALAELPVITPERTVRTDVARLVGAPQLWSRIRVSGYSYDTATGVLTPVVAATSATGH